MVKRGLADRIYAVFVPVVICLRRAHADGGGGRGGQGAGAAFTARGRVMIIDWDPCRDGLARDRDG